MCRIIAFGLTAVMLSGCGQAIKNLISSDSSAPATFSLDLTSGNITVPEGSSAILFPVLSSARSTPTIVNIALTSSVGDVNSDFVSAPTSYIIPAGQTTAPLTLTTFDDSDYEGDELFTLTISSPNDDVLIGTSSITLLVTDNESPLPDISIDSLAAVIEGTGISFTVTLNRASTDTVTVDFASSDGTAVAGADYTAVSGTLTFAPGETSKSITVSTTDDALYEGATDETLVVTLANGTNGTITTATGAASITDNETLPTVTFASAAQTVSESAGTVTVTMTLSGTSVSSISVPYTITGTATASLDHDLNDGTLNITAGQTTADVTFSVSDDAIYEGTETVILTMGSPTNATSLAPTVHIVSITNNDTAPSVTLDSASQSVSESAGTVTITLTQSAVSATATTVPFTVNAGSTAVGSGTDYSIAASPLTIAAGFTTASITVTLVDDATAESSETVVVDLGTPTNASLGATQSHILTITDNDLGAFAIAGVTGGTDVTDDALLGSGVNATVSWAASQNATSYDVTIYESNGTTVKCATQNTVALTYAFGSCNLTAGSTYKAVVTAKLASATLDASNSQYSFMVNQPPTVTTSGPWYVLSSGSITIQALYAASPAVGTAADADGDTLTFTAVGTASGGIGSITNNSTNVVYAANGYTGVDTFTFTISDGRGGTVSGTMTIHAVTAYTWTGNGANANWNTAANWCGAVNTNKNGCTNGGSSPSSTGTSTHVAIYDGTCSGTYCSPTINVAASMYGMRMNSGYGGTITQSNTVAVGAGGWSQAAGTFTGNGSTFTTSSSGNFTQSGGIFTQGGGALSIAGNMAISGGLYTQTNGTMAITGTYTLSSGTFAGGSVGKTVTGTLTISGGTYTASSAITTIRSNLIVSGTPSFTHNSSTFLFAGGGAGDGSTYTFTPGSVVFYNLDFTNGHYNTYTMGGGTAISAGTLTLNSTFSSIAINNGTFEVRGHLTASGNGANGTATINIAGSGNQTITGASGANILAMAINSTGGTVTFVGTLTLASSYVYNSGTLDLVSSSPTLKFNGGCGGDGTSCTLTPGSISYYNVDFANSHYNTYNLGGATMTVTGTLTLGSTAFLACISNGTVVATGTVNFSSNGICGTATIQIAGSGNQTVTAVTGASIPNLNIASTGGIVTLSGIFKFINGYSYLSGTVDALSNLTTFRFVGVCSNPGTTCNIIPGSVDYYNVTFENSQYNTYDLNAGTMKINGTLSVGTPGYRPTFTNGTLRAFGNVNIIDSGMGSTTTGKILIAGNPSGQTITGVSGAFTPNLQIDAGANPVTLSGTIQFGSSASTYTYISSGTMTTTGSLLRFDGDYNASRSITFGSPTYNDVTFTGNIFTTNNLLGSVSIGGNMTVNNASGIYINMPNPGGAYSMAVTGTLTVGTTDVLNLYGASLSYGSLSNSGTINP